jgi:hypothetical protein
MTGTTRRLTGPLRFLGRTILFSVAVGFLAGLAAKTWESGPSSGDRRAPVEWKRSRFAGHSSFCLSEDMGSIGG